MKTIITIFTIILSITIVSAIYAGECNSIEFPNTEEVNWSVEGNSSNMEGFSYTKNGTAITYCFHPLYKPDSFTLTFYNYQEVIVKEDSPVWYSFGGGGSSSSTTTTENKTEEVVEETDETIDEEIILDEEEKSYLWVSILAMVIVLIIIIIIFINKYNKKDGEEITENN